MSSDIIYAENFPLGRVELCETLEPRGPGFKYVVTMLPSEGKPTITYNGTSVKRANRAFDVARRLMIRLEQATSRKHKGQV